MGEKPIAHLKPRARKLLHASRSPAEEGIWYWIWYGARRGWKLEGFRSDISGDLDHVRVWTEVIVPALAKTFHLRGSKVVALKNLPYCMPRGRMARAPEDVPAHRIPKGDWLLWHGGDLPTGMDPDHAKRLVISAFDLDLPTVMHRVHWLEDDHENMMAYDRAQLELILGKAIPY